MKILAIETSCDETSVAVLECQGDLPKAGESLNLSFDVLAHSLNSQIDMHQEYGGVFPSVAKREHGRNLTHLLQQVLKKSGFGISNSQFPISNQFSNDKISKLEDMLKREPELLKQFLDYIPRISIPEIDAIAVTVGPGLEPALWVGLNFAKALSLVWDKPLIPVNHMEGHIFSVLIQNRKENPKSEIRNPKQIASGKNVQNMELGIRNYENSPHPTPFTFPMISLLISGGHTQLVLVKDWGEYEIVGETRDDAVGEAFDKVARMLGLPYPGGPQISRLAEEARNSPKSEVRSLETKLPRPMLNTDDFDFSFSGLKTAVLYKIKDRVLDDSEKIAIAREFEDAVTEVLVKKTKNALIKSGATTLVVGGGVIANKHIRESLEEMTKEIGVEIKMPERDLTGDNAIMIGVVGYIKSKEKGESRMENGDLVADGNLRL